MDTRIAELNKEYGFSELKEADLDPSPFTQFRKWFEEALKADLIHPNAVTLATVDKSGKPSARMMLLKGADKDGFVFYTNKAAHHNRSSF